MDVFYCQVNNAPMIEPFPVFKWFSKKFVENCKDSIHLLKCPSFRDELNNTFLIKSNFYYELHWDGTIFNSPMYDQKFFDENVNARDVNNGVCSINYPNIIFISEKSLQMSLIPAYLHSNNFVNNTILLPGIYNIGKHVRPTELPFIFKEKGKVEIEEESTLCYIKFHTEEKIKFKPFFYCDEMKQMVYSSLKQRNSFKYHKPLEWWYNLNLVSNRMKKYISLAKKNLFYEK